MAALSGSERLLALRFRDFRQMTQHAQRELIDHREQRGELVRERLEDFRRRGATGLNDSFFSRCESGIRVGQPGVAFRLKEPLLHVSDRVMPRSSASSRSR